MSRSVVICEREHLPLAGCREQTLDGSAPAPEEARSLMARWWAGTPQPSVQVQRPFSTLPEAQTRFLSKLFSVTPTGGCSLVNSHAIV